MTPKLKKIIIIVPILIVMFIVYAIYVKQDPEQTVFIDGRGATQSDARIMATQISQALLRIEQIKLDKSIFANPIYLSLVDRSRPINPEPTGRQNPFAPIGVIGLIQIPQEDDEENEDL